MAKLKAADLRQLSGDELRSKVSELKEELFGLRFQAATGQLEDTARIREAVSYTHLTLPTSELV